MESETAVLRSSTRAIRVRALGHWQRVVAIALQFGDLLIVSFVGVVTFRLRDQGGAIDGSEILALALGVLLAGNALAIAGCYNVKAIDRLTTQLMQVALGWSAAILCLLAALFLVKISGEISRLWIGSWYLTTLVGLVALRCGGRLWIARARESDTFSRRLVIVREHDVPLDRILEGIRMDPSLTPVVDMVVNFESPEQVDGFLDEFRDLQGIEQLLLVCNRPDTKALSHIVQQLRHLPIEVNLVAAPLAGDIPVIGICVVGTLPATVLLERPLEGLPSAIKGVFDRVVAACLLLGVGPFLLLIALFIKLDSRGPVLFRQTRFGFNREKIEVLKFRTMYRKHCGRTQDNKIVQATRNDPRVTRVGRILRRTSFDELPQLINVLKGDMSLVGPRPHALEHDRHYAELIDGYLDRHRVKPGISGWAQVNGCRGETKTVDEMRRRIELDLHYIDNWSLAFDIKILLRTLVVGMVHDKAY